MVDVYAQGLCSRQTARDTLQLTLQGQVPQWLLNPHNLSLYASLCATHQQAANLATMAPGSCQANHLLGLTKTHALQDHSTATMTLQLCYKKAGELADLLQSADLSIKQLPASTWQPVEHEVHSEYHQEPQCRRPLS